MTGFFVNHRAMVITFPSRIIMLRAKYVALLCKTDNVKANNHSIASSYFHFPFVLPIF